MQELLAMLNTALPRTLLHAGQGAGVVLPKSEHTGDPEDLLVQGKSSFQSSSQQLASVMFVVEIGV